MPGNDDFDLVKEAINRLVSLLRRLPKPAQEAVKEPVDTLLAIVRDHRVSRVMMFGRRGSGKSALVNAFFGAEVKLTSSVRAATGQATWDRYEYGGRSIEILDTRGVQESSRPVEADKANTAVESLFDAIQAAPPDVILFVVAATDVDVAMEGDLEALVKIHQRIIKLYGNAPVIVPVLSKCDQLDPGDIRFPTDDADKHTNLAEATEVLGGHLKSRDYLTPFLIDPIPTVAYAVYNKETRQPIPGRDYRWQMDALTEVIFDNLPDEAKLDFSRLQSLRIVQARLARKIVDTTTLACGGIGAQSIPCVDLPILTGMQVSMIMVIGYIGGTDLSLKAARDFLSAIGLNVAAGMAFRELARALIKVIPGAGNAISGAVAAGATKTIGESAIAYYIENIKLENVRSSFQRRMKDLQPE